MTLLDDASIAAAVTRLDWERQGRELVKVVVLGDFAQAIEYVQAVAGQAEAIDHHPDIAVSWNRVTLRLTTHSAGGLTAADLDLADRIDALRPPAPVAPSAETDVSPDVVLVRHGETEWSRLGRHTGGTDVVLTESGRDQARGLVGRMTMWSWSAVLASPRVRALETARLAGVGDRVVVVPDLAEWDYGDYEGKTTDEIWAERPGWSLWTDGAPGGESLADVGARADRVVRQLREETGHVAVFAHGHILRVLASRWVGQAVSFGANLGPLPTASISVLSGRRGIADIAAWALR